MHSELLKNKGVLNYISGKEFSMSYKKEGDKVRENAIKLCEKIGADIDNVYTGVQTHTINIKYCDGVSGDDFLYGRNFKDTDGLITDKKNLALIMKFADCTPVVLFDDANKVLCAVHSGWRGTVGRISEVAINKMVDEFSTDVKNIYAYIGPSIDQDNYEVGEEVYDAFSEFKSRDEFFYKKGEKYHLDMIGSNLSILLECGVPRENIEISEVSTFNSENLHSARRDGDSYGLNAMIVMME